MPKNYDVAGNLYNQYISNVLKQRMAYAQETPSVQPTNVLSGPTEIPNPTGGSQVVSAPDVGSGSMNPPGYMGEDNSQYTAQAIKKRQKSKSPETYSATE